MSARALAGGGGGGEGCRATLREMLLPAAAPMPLRLRDSPRRRRQKAVKEELLLRNCCVLDIM